MNDFIDVLELRFVVRPCGRGRYWIVDTVADTESSPRATYAEAEARRLEIIAQWRAAEAERRRERLGIETGY